jgi:ribosomal protein S24E
MDVTILKEHDMPLLQRKEYALRIAVEGATPTRAKLVDSIAHKLKAQRNTVVVRKVQAEFGTQSAIVDVSVYTSAEALASFESAHMKKRHEKGAPKAEEAPAESEA